MTTSPGQPPRDEVAPPREFAGRLHRTGYLALAASGLALCTAFAAVAQIIQPVASDQQTTQTGRSTGGGEPTQLVPGEAVPADTTVVIDGVAVTGELPTSSSTPTTIVTTDENGNRHTSVHTPSGPPARSSSGNGGGDDDGSGREPTNQPGPQPSDPPKTSTPPSSPPSETPSSSQPPTTSTDDGPGDGEGDGGGGGASPSGTAAPTSMTTSDGADVTSEPRSSSLEQTGTATTTP
ncbi:hypothetical protein AB8O38_05875 [Saccharomonospora xinjiangensis]|uniref:hypothetical protein n=1 Tax=Saccharomonospora xinjiangensis TaxID=75294 RepID=UPI003510AD73